MTGWAEPAGMVVPCPHSVALSYTLSRDTTEFLAKPTNERANIAKAFFHEHIEPITMRTYVDVETFRTEFVKSATLSIEEAPIENWRYVSDGTPYRDLREHLWHGGIQLSKIAFSLGTLLSAVLGGAMIATVLSLMITDRWAYRGFSARLALVLWVAWMLGVVGYFWYGYIQATAAIARDIHYEVAAGSSANRELAEIQMQELDLNLMHHPPLTFFMLFGVVGLGLPILLYGMLRGVLRWIVRGFKPDGPH